MHKSHNEAYNDSLWTEIETIHCVLAQILMLLRQSTAAADSYDVVGIAKTI
jgi:hypothetical protein